MTHNESALPEIYLKKEKKMANNNHLFLRYML